MIPDILINEIVELEKLGYQIETEEIGSRVYIIFKNFQLPDGFNMRETDLLVWTGVNYPSCAFDMFWVDEKLLLSNGQEPHAANYFEVHCNEKWRRFSIHPYNHKRWDPSEDSLRGYLSYINKRLNHLR